MLNTRLTRGFSFFAGGFSTVIWFLPLKLAHPLLASNLRP
jgi:hypothetical protein